MKLYIGKSEDRDAVVVVLARNGYTVRIGKEKRDGDKIFSHFVEIVEKEGVKQ